MSEMLLDMDLTKKRLFIILCLLAAPVDWARGEASVPWPFDQRQILLVRDEKLPFPDEPTTAQFMDIFVKKGRVRWVTQKAGAGQVVPIEIPNDFQWQSSSAIRQLGLKYKTDGIVFLAQRGVQLDLRWYATIDGEPLFFETVNLPSASNPVEQEIRKKRLNDWLSEIWSRIPGQGYVVKRDMTTVSLEGASQVGLKVGNQIEIRRLLEVQRHPLLKTLIGIQSHVTGTAKVTSIAEPFTTAKIEYESKTDPIQEGDRYQLQVTPGPGIEVAGTEAVKAAKPDVIDAEGRTKLSIFGDDQDEEESEDAPRVENSSGDEPQFGVIDASGGLTVGASSYSETVSGTVYEMKGFSPGVYVNARAYITRSWLLLGDLSGNFFTFKDLSSAYNATSIKSGSNSVGFAGAYRFIFLEEAPMRGELILGVGYRRFALAMSQIVSAFAPSAKTYSGFEFSFGIQIPLLTEYALQFRAARMFGTSLGEKPGTSGSDSSNQYWDFLVGLKYRLDPASEITGGYRLNSASSTFEGAGSRTRSATATAFKQSLFFADYTRKF